MRSLLSLFIASSVLLAAQTNTTKPETGWRFGEAPKENIKKIDIKKMLEKLLKIQKEQLKTQKEILAILKKQFAPEPKKIVVNGKECIENSSAECFKMPITPQAARIPVLKNWLENPTKENAKEWLRWQAKYFTQIFNVGNSLQFAIAQWGDKAYPLSFEREGFETVGGYSTVLEDKRYTYLLNSVADKYDVYIFFGKNWQGDFYSFDNYADLAKELHNVNFNLVFYSEGAKEAFDDAAKTFTNLDKLIKRSRIYVGKKYFKKFNVYTTPTLLVRLKKSNTIEPVYVGKTDIKTLKRKMIDFLEYRKVLDMAHSPDYKMWQENADYANSYLKHYYGVELNASFIKSKYGDN